MNELELRIEAYRQSLLSTVDRYEDKIISLRIELTRKEQEIERLQAELNESEGQSDTIQ